MARPLKSADACLLMTHDGKGNALILLAPTRATGKCSFSNDVNANLSSETVRVRFGNPALGTYGGCVVFAPTEDKFGSSSSNTDDVKDGKKSSAQKELTPNLACLAAMVQVPPEQVPEGVLTLARAHRQNIFHVRIAISKGEGSFDNRNDDDPNLDRSRISDGENLTLSTYLVLFELHTPEAADLFVNDLNGKPFTSLVPNEICCVRRVMKADGDDGVNIMSPFFATLLPKSFSGSEDVDRKNIRAKGSKEDGSPAGTFRVPSTSSQVPSLALADDAEPAHFKRNNSGVMDIQNCAVCLEPMETIHVLMNNAQSRQKSTAAKLGEPILTTVCNHSFHINCLLKWQDSPCPVCRYNHSGLNSETLSECHLCGTKENNYMCLICGMVSCSGSGRVPCFGASEVNLEREPSTSCEDQHPANRGHARTHYEDTLHTYALETGTQYVWDFAGGGYVHRLIRNSEDGKLVEINDPANTTSNERSTHPSYISDAQEEESTHRKLEDFADQYNTLLKSQLEQQRIYYEGRLTEMKRERARSEESDTTRNLIAALKQKRHQLQQRHNTLQCKQKKMSEKLSFLKSTNESLEQNKTLLEEKHELAKKKEADEQDGVQQKVATLEKKVTMLMQKLDSPCNNPSMADDRKPSAK